MRIIGGCAAILSVAMTLLENNWDTKCLAGGKRKTNKPEMQKGLLDINSW